MSKKITALSTVGDSRKYLRENFDKGCKCPSCGQFVKLYIRKLGSAQSRALIRTYHLNKEQEWVHIREISKEINITGDYAKLVYWGLIEEKENQDTKKKNSGFWKITQRGKDFVECKISLPSHVMIYNSKFQGFKDSFVMITECIGKKFNYSELINI